MSISQPTPFYLGGTNVLVRGIVCSWFGEPVIQYTSIGQEDTTDLLAGPPGSHISYPVVSPDGHYLAYISGESDEQYGTLHITSFTEPSIDNTLMAIDNVTGRVAWYDPTP
jgi:hypothetical protein